MKTNLLKTVLAGAALLMGVTASAQPKFADNVKNYLAVTGMNGTTPVTVSSTVYEGFGFTVQLPNPNNAIIGADYAKAELALNNVYSLGLGGQTRYQSWEYTTSTTSQIDLTKYLEKSYAMNDVSVPVTVIDGDEQQSFVYDIAAINNSYQIVGTPSSYPEASAAWKMIASRVVCSQNTRDDSQVEAKKGSYIQIGDQRLTLDNDAVLFQGTDWTKSGEKAKITTTETYLNVTDQETYKAVIYMPAGSTLVIGQSQAVLQKNAKITFDFSILYKMMSAKTRLTDQIDELKRISEKSGAEGAMDAIKYFDKIVGLISDARYVPTTVEFTTDEVNLTIYSGDGTVTEGATEADFAAVRAEYPNSMAVLVEGTPTDYTNILVPGDDKWVCPNFVLTDLSKNKNVVFAATTDWYAPFNFTAEKGSYVRYNNATGYASVCVPFAITSDMLNGSTILTYDYYDGDVTAYFNEVTENEAGVPCNVYSTGGDWTITFDNTPIVAEVADGNDTYGTYTTTEKYATNYYGVNSNHNKFSPLAKYLYPFRACLDLNTSAPIKEIGVKVNDATAIKNVETPTTGAQTIYTISGARVNKVSQPGLYIINGKKTLVK